MTGGYATEENGEIGAYSVIERGYIIKGPEALVQWFQ